MRLLLKMTISAPSFVQRFLAWLVVAALVLPALTSAQTTQAAAPKVLLLNADSGSTAFVRSGLVSTGLFAPGDIADMTMPSTPPSLATLQAYGCVLVWTNFSPPNPVGNGDRLKEYVDAGGGVVLAVYALSRIATPWEMQGGIMQNGYSPLDLTNTSLTSFPRSLDFSTALTSHPILSGVTNFTYGGNANYASVTLDPGATLVGKDNGGVPLLAVNAGGKVAGINVYPGSAFSKSSGVWRTFANACYAVAAGSQNQPPTANANGPYTVAEGGSVALNGSGSDPDGDPLTYAWDLDNNGSFETAGQSVTFSAAGKDGPSSQTVALQVCDDKNACATSNATVNITNVAPTVNAGPDATLFSGQSLAGNASFTDAGTPDTHTATINWGDGSPVQSVSVVQGAGSGSLSASHQYFVPGNYTVTVCVTDDDGDTGCDSLALEVKRLPVRVDIKPGSDPNSINLKSKGNVPVGVLSDPSASGFDATAIDRATVVFAGAPALSIGKSPEDVNGDGVLDQVFHFDTPALNLTASSTQACLTGVTMGGVYFEGCDSVRIVPR